MLALANIVQGLAAVLGLLLNFFFILLIGRAIISWVNADPYNTLVRFIVQSTEPVLAPIRRRLPPIGGGTLDLSPLIVLALIYFLQIALVQSLNDMALRWRTHAVLAP